MPIHRPPLPLSFTRYPSAFTLHPLTFSVTIRSLINPAGYPSMFRFLLRCTFLILIFEALLFGQEMAGNQKTSFPAPGSAPPSTAKPGVSAPSF